VPTLSAQLAKVRFQSGLHDFKPLVWFEHAILSLRGLYRRIGPGVVRWRWAVLGVAVLALFGATRLTSGLGNEFLPQVDDGNVNVFIGLPPGSSAEETNRITREVEGMIGQMPYVKHVFATAGGFMFGAGTNENAGRGSIEIVLASSAERRISADAWVQQLQAMINERGFPGARVFVRPPRIRGLRTSTAGSDVAITVQGDDLAELQRLADDIQALTRGIPGLENVRPSADEASPQLSIELDRERAAYLGLNVAAVGQTLRTALDGTVATRFTSGNQEYDVRVMLPRERFTSPEDVGSVALFPGGGGGAPIYLRDVANVYTRLGPTSILRENQNRVLRLTGDVITEVASVGVVNDSMRARLAALEVPEGYAVVFGGEEEAIRENNRQLRTVILLAIFLVFVVLAVQYESLINPFVILLAIPLSLIGVSIGLWATGTAMSAPVLLGVILLAGIVVNNSILLVEYAEQIRRRRGLSREAAVVEAGAIRLRPIMMTTLTTAFGMMPLALGIGQGSELMRPLAIAVVSGLSVSMLLTLFVIPSAYVILNRAAETLGRWIRGGGTPGAPLRRGARARQEREREEEQELEPVYRAAPGA
jgi:multidrug efflux pump subunit AcrB